MCVCNVNIWQFIVIKRWQDAIKTWMREVAIYRCVSETFPCTIYLQFQQYFHSYIQRIGLMCDVQYNNIIMSIYGVSICKAFVPVASTPCL